MIRRASLLFLGLACAAATALANPAAPSIPAVAVPDVRTVYKRVDGVDLELHLFRPKGWQPEDRRPAIVFFFGGGWRGGSPRRLMPFARYFADLGMVAACADYRVYSRHSALPSQCVEDAKSAIRWLRIHAGEQGLDPDHIVAAGDSAGGHLAISTAIVEGFDAPGEATDVSAAANAFVLLNPVLDAVREEENDGRVGSMDLARRLSPQHNIRAPFPPVLILHGTADERVPYQQALDFQEGMSRAGNDIVLWTAEGGAHTFWLRPPWRDAVRQPMVGFLTQRGFLPVP